MLGVDSATSKLFGLEALGNMEARYGDWIMLNLSFAENNSAIPSTILRIKKKLFRVRTIAQNVQAGKTQSRQTMCLWSLQIQRFAHPLLKNPLLIFQLIQYY